MREVDAATMQSGQDADPPGERPGVNLGLTAAADRARPGSSTATPGTARGHPADIADRGLHGRNAPVDRAAGPDRPDADRGLPSCGLRPTCYRYAQYPEPGGCTGSRTVAVLSVAVGAARRCRSGVLHIRCSIPAPTSETRPPAPARGRVRRAEPSSLAAASGLAGRTDDRHGEHAGHSTLTDH